jgi:hypothetical protein
VVSAGVTVSLLLVAGESVVFEGMGVGESLLVLLGLGVAEW